MKQKVKQFLKKRPIRLRKAAPESRLNQAIENLPHITNETVAEHREELLSTARKYIYPLTHSKHYIIKISVALFVVGIIVFFSYTGLALYKFHSSSKFLYYVTQVVPFPVAKAGGSYVSYENYLFQLRHYTHYYQTQQQVDFTLSGNKEQLEVFRKQALQRVVDNAYISQLAAKHNVSVSGREVEEEVELVRQQNRLGGSDEEFANVLSEFWGWSVDDFKRELKQQMLAQKVVSALDTATHSRAKSALEKVKSGANFGKLAARVSQDNLTKNEGGVYSFEIDKNNRDLSPQVVDELFKLKPGQVSGIINTGHTLEIVKVISKNGGKVRAAHVMFTFKSIDDYIKPLKQQKPPRLYIKV